MSWLVRGGVAGDIHAQLADKEGVVVEEGEKCRASKGNSELCGRLELRRVLERVSGWILPVEAGECLSGPGEAPRF